MLQHVSVERAADEVSVEERTGELQSDESPGEFPAGESVGAGGTGGLPGDASAGDSADEVPDEATPDVEMDHQQVVSFLQGQGWGCLTLADGDAAYSIPMSFGYDGESTLYFQLQAGGEKMSYLDATTTATFLVPEVSPPDWTSVVVRGEIERVPDDELDAAYAAIADNAWFPACPWSPGTNPADVEFYRLDADEMTGRESLLSE